MQRNWLDSYSNIPSYYWTPGKFLFKKSIYYILLIYLKGNPSGDENCYELLNDDINRFGVNNTTCA